MALGIQDLINQARDIVQDTGMESDYSEDRHTNAKLIRYLNSALSDAFRMRPDLFFPNVYDRNIPEMVVDDITNNTPFPVDQTYFTAFAEYVAGYVGLSDDEFAQDGRAATLLNRFSQKLMGKGA
jgi:hypothetical protein